MWRKTSINPSGWNKMHVIKLNGYNATTENGEKLELGTFDSYGEEQLQIVKAPDWENLSAIATFNPPNKKPVQVVIDSVTGIIKVPKEATADLYGIGTIVFVGLADGVQRISADVEYIVRKHSNASGTEPAKPTPSVVEQILTEAQNANASSAEAKKLATDAKDIAQSVRTDADKGKFNGAKGETGAQGERGEKGDKGDPGADAKVDDTLTKPGEAADAKKTGDGLSSINIIIEQLTQKLEELTQQVTEYSQQLEQYKQQQAITITGITNAITAIGGDVTGTQEDKTWLITS